MGRTKQQLSREDVAKIEIGRTTVRRPVAWGLIAAFVATVYAVPIGQHVHEVRAAFARRPGLTWRQVPLYLPQCYDIFRSVPRAWRAVLGGPEELSLFRRTKRANDQILLREIDEYTDAIREDSLLSDVLLPPAQRLMVRSLGVGSEQAYVGRGGWLFYRPDVDYVTGPGFLSARHARGREIARKAWEAPSAVDPVPAIVAFARRLHRRGIRLILFPTPVKPMIHPEMLSGRFEDCREVLQNPSYRRFVRRLDEQAGRVILFDPSEEMMSLKFSEHPPRPLYLRTDTHWLPETMELAAGRLTAAVRKVLAETPPPGGPAKAYREEPVEVTHVGDVGVMLQPVAQSDFARGLHAAIGGAADRLGLAGAAAVFATDRRRLFPAETVTIRRVLTPEGTPWQPDRSGDVLLLGDSFSNVYSHGQMGWGSSAGLAERLSFHLARPVDVLIRNDAGAHATRKLLADELRAGRDRLAGKKVVIWQFAVRELSIGDWKSYPMELGRPGASPSRPSAGVTDVLALAPGERAVVTGRIAALTRPPRPGTVPYKDFIMAVHLEDVRNASGSVRGAEAVVFVWGMRDRRWTPNARLKLGRRITVSLRPWDDVVGRYGTVRRGEIQDVDLDVGSFWGEGIQ
jgi:hypothetical protein